MVFISKWYKARISEIKYYHEEQWKNLFYSRQGSQSAPSGCVAFKLVQFASQHVIVVSGPRSLGVQL